ncbi:solute carrier family 45 member 3 isoform X1 [Colius striatus]|uniref:solute carrier family 45 member 3 isoform X1 n=1 Tax=Colius striatus TaxID=57412 RepID=UPI002B1E0981|nr:solute carrier family 45 member 3 isoform X1 [Colius striatus]XP_061869616.1 solute carrier family 45 member 3 isoform X1 [Colius striatus]XP_061869617.1 solute carrier family 45 member 3 isoform X1 [Colius striatus]XP_061869618.1 solute carrier family 45 member 3 isoform X1 [Colius striatus]XP_061869619.1 solute carrier family 45 member 3 isoform X1 [Colius striatus]XP_061869620.1 solute carrier family 45 member 3 isoform X1 [Colius striatus]XP_061869621.1 solute carrier family 45 member 
MAQRAQASKTQLLLVNSLTFGLEVCLAAGITYMPPLLLEVGVEEKFMTMVLGIGPVLGLVFVPLIGSASDHWHSSYGRRRPFIWMLCLGVLLSLFVIPHASSLASLFTLNARPLEIAFLILGIGLLDCCGQVCFTPLEALLSDLFQDPDNCRQAFSMYAFMISLGGCIGYLLPAIDWGGSFLAPYLGGQETCLFGLLAIIFLGCVLATLFVTEEAATQVDVLDGPEPKDAPPKPSPPACCSCQLSRSSCLLQARHVMQALRSLCTLAPRLHSLYCRIPKVIRRLFVAEFCSWMALMTFMLFYTDFVGEGLYHGVPRAKPGTDARRHYDEGVRMGSLGLFLQCITSVFFSTIMDRLVKQFGTRTVYLASVVFFPGAAFVMCVSHSITIVTVSAALTGFTFSALQILPYTLASLYHHEKQFKHSSRSESVERAPRVAVASSLCGIVVKSPRGHLSWSSLLCTVSVFLHKYKSKEEEDATCTDKKSAFSKGLLSSQKLPYQNGHTGSLYSSSSSPSSTAATSSALCVSSSCDVSLMMMMGEADSVAPSRGICLDLAVLDSAFLLSQVVPSLFMGSIVQFTESVTAYMVSAAGFGLVAIYFATKVVFDKSDMVKYSV